MRPIRLILDDLDNVLYQWDTGQRFQVIGVDAGALVDFVQKPDGVYTVKT